MPDTDERSGAARLRRVPREIVAFLLLSVGLWVWSVVSVVWQLRFSVQAHHGLPFDVYTRHPFEDMDEFVRKMPMVHSPAFFREEWVYLYPAPAVFLYRFFSWFDHVRSFRFPHAGSDLALCGVVLTGLLVLGSGLQRAMVQRGLQRRRAVVVVVLSAALSWPILYAMHQGNLESVIWMGVAVALWAYWTGRWWTAAVLLGLFGSFKIYPLLFLALFLRARRFRELGLALIVFVLVTVVALWYIGPTIPVAYAEVSHGVAFFNAIGLTVAGVQTSSAMFDHSLSGLLHLLLRSHAGMLARVLRWYMPVAAVVATVVFFGRVWRQPRVNQILFLTLAAVSLPTTSFDYTLELLYLPWACLVLLAVRAAVEGGTRLKGSMAAMMCLALLCSPELFVHWRGRDVFGQFKAAVILVLFAVCLRWSWSETERNAA